MKLLKLHRYQLNRGLSFSLVLIAATIAASFVFGHGGKHSDRFTQLQALQKATKLYDQLIEKGKLDQTWETGLENVAISNRKHEGKDEIMVAFQRKDGDPNAVYIFLEPDGKYAGSNFTGK